MLANDRAPADSVYSDFTTTGALHHLESMINDTEGRVRLPQGRVQIINVWRPLKTIRRNPLAVCDWITVDWQRDRIANRLILPMRWNELAKYAFNPVQRWCYLVSSSRTKLWSLSSLTMGDWRREEWRCLIRRWWSQTRLMVLRGRVLRSRCLPFRECTGVIMQTRRKDM